MSQAAKKAWKTRRRKKDSATRRGHDSRSENQKKLLHSLCFGPITPNNQEDRYSLGWLEKAGCATSTRDERNYYPTFRLTKKGRRKAKEEDG